MENTIAVFTIFTLFLFSVTTATMAVGQIGSESSTKSVAVADLDGVLSIEKPKSELDQTKSTDRSLESEYAQTIELVDPTPRLRFPRLLPINRHVFEKTSRIPLRFVRRQPCRKFQRKFMLPRTERSYGNDMIVSTNTYSVDTKSIGDQVPTEWLEFKHRYGRHHHHHHNNDEESVVSSSRHQKREHKDGFMRTIRKFLKHTFD